MLTQLQLEGKELEPLLDRVRSELGPRARILSAEKVRSGGIGGFFARQRFELTVEVDDVAVDGLSADDLPGGGPTAADGIASDAAAAPASLLELADRVSDHEHATAVSTETPSFTSLLSRLGVSIDGAPSADTPTVPSAAAAGAPRSEPSPVPAPVARLRTEPPVTTAVVVTRDDAVAHEALVQAALAPTTTTVPSQRPPQGAATGDRPFTGELTRLGLPAHLQPVDGDEPVYPALLRSLRRLPKAPRTEDRGGEVLAVAGPLHLALGLARQLAGDLDLAVESAVFVATDGPLDAEVPVSQRVHDVATATSHRATWRALPHLTVVAIDAPLTSAGAEQARSYLAALSPIAVWGVVEATRKAHDVGVWTRAVGGVHALALTGVEETADPAAVLALGIPVGRLGSRPASPAAWASLLTGRRVS